MKYLLKINTPASRLSWKEYGSSGERNWEFFVTTRECLYYAREVEVSRGHHDPYYYIRMPSSCDYAVVRVQKEKMTHIIESHLDEEKLLGTNFHGIYDGNYGNGPWPYSRPTVKMSKEDWDQLVESVTKRLSDERKSNR